MIVNFENLQKAIAEVGELLATNRAIREHLASERDRIAALPFNRADLIEAYDRWIMESAEFYRNQLQEGVKVFSRHPDRGLPRPSPETDKLGLLAQRDKNFIPFTAILALCEPVIRAQVRAIIAELPLDDADGLPMPERTEALRDLDARIEALDEEIARIEAQATRAGLNPSRRQPTPEELAAAFSGGIPTNPAVYARTVENLTRRLNGEPSIPPEPLQSSIKVIEEFPE